MSFLYRTTPATLHGNSSDMEDDLTNRFLGELLGEETPPTDVEWKDQVALPLGKGGLGLNWAKDTAWVQSLASIHACLRYLKDDEKESQISTPNGSGQSHWYLSNPRRFQRLQCLCRAATATQKADLQCNGSRAKKWVQDAKLRHPHQLLTLDKKISSQILRSYHAVLYHSLTTKWKKRVRDTPGRARDLRTALRVQSASGPHAAVWSYAIPNNPVLTIPNTPFRLRLRRLMGRHPNYEVPPACACGEPLERDLQAIHFEFCAKGRVNVHNNVLRTIHDMTHTAGIPAHSEVMGRNVFRTCNDDKRLDIVFYNHFGLPPIIGDVTIWHPATNTTVNDILDTKNGTVMDRPGRALSKPSKTNKTSMEPYVEIPDLTWRSTRWNILDE